MRWLIEIMREWDRWYPPVGYQPRPVWLVPMHQRIARKASDLGLVYKPSYSQCHWTERGIELALKYCPDALARSTEA